MLGSEASRWWQCSKRVASHMNSDVFSSLVLDGCASMHIQWRTILKGYVLIWISKLTARFLCSCSPEKGSYATRKLKIWIWRALFFLLYFPPLYLLLHSILFVKCLVWGGSGASVLTWSIWEVVHHLQNQDLIRGQYLSCQQVVVHYSDWSSIQFHDFGLYEACTCVLLPDLLLCWWIFSLTYWRCRAETCRYQGSRNGDISTH